MPSSSSPWPDECRGAVSLTFDDGLPSQLDRAIPILNDHGLCATFYLNPSGDDWRDRLAPWRTVAQMGHEIGNHTINHPCSWAFSDDRAGGLEAMTLDDIEADIAEAKRRIDELISEQTANSFCYPCYHTHVGEGPTRQSYVPVVARYHPAGRAKGDYANHGLTCDLHHLFSWPVERHAGSEMIGLVEQAVSQGRWAVLTFHGILEGHLAVAEVDFIELCTHLARHRSRIRVDTVINMAQRIQEWRSDQV